MPAILLLALARHGTLAVETPHYGATISVDRRPIGTAPVAPQRVAVGWHLVEVFARGRPPWGRLVFVAPDRILTLSVVLEALPTAREAPAAAGRPPAVWRLTGRAGLRGAARGPDRSAALEQRARLEGDEVAGADTRLVVDLAGESQLSSSGRSLLRLISPDDPSRLRIDAAWVGWRSIRGGRLPLIGPGAALVVLDGVEATGAWQRWQVDARLGARGAPVGGRPEEPLVAIGLAHTAGPVRGHARWWHHDHHYGDGGITAQGARWRLASAASLVDARLHRAQVEGRWDAVDLGYTVRGPARGALVDPLRTLGLDPLDRIAWHGPRLRVLLGERPWVADAQARVRMSAQGARFDGGIGVERRQAAWRLGMRLDGLASRWSRSPPAPHLRQRIGARVEAGWGRAATVALGGAWQATDRSRQVLPEGAVRLTVPLVDRLELYAEAAGEAVDPAVLAGEGLLWHGRVGVRLR